MDFLGWFMKCWHIYEWIIVNIVLWINFAKNKVILDIPSWTFAPFLEKMDICPLFGQGRHLPPHIFERADICPSPHTLNEKQKNWEYFKFSQQILWYRHTYIQLKLGIALIYNDINGNSSAPWSYDGTCSKSLFTIHPLIGKTHIKFCWVSDNYIFAYNDLLMCANTCNNILLLSFEQLVVVGLIMCFR